MVIYHDYLGVGKWADDEEGKSRYDKGLQSYIRECRKTMRINFCVKVKGHSGDKY